MSPCIYHGWAYDQEGKVVDTPAEPPDSNFKYTIRHLAYPCVELAGLIFAYLGPAEKKPIFPKYEQLFREDGLRVTGNAQYIERCNVFQALHDNALDPWHSQIAHGWFRRGDWALTLSHGQRGDPAPVRYERTPWGTRSVRVRTPGEPGKFLYHNRDMPFPCLMSTNGVDGRGSIHIEWAVPVDDYRTRWFGVQFFPHVDGKPTEAALRAQGNAGFNRGNVPPMPPDWTEQVGRWDNFDHPWRGGNLWEDEVAQGSQGSPENHFLPDWEKWHLGTSDRGVVLNRQVWREQIERVQQGLDPIGVVRDPSQDELIRMTPPDVYGLDLEEAMLSFETPVEEQAASISSQPEPPWRRSE